MGINIAQHEMEAKSITDVPNEIIQKFIAVHLSNSDVCSFGRTGIPRFEELAQDIIEKRGGE